MHCFDNGFAIICVIVGFVFINCSNENLKDKSESDKDEDITPEDLYSFIALLDLVFTDGTKKTCTGTIIHDNVVITTAHCFQIDDDNIVQVELTASFVVIGTKKMFETGYEQYLPIERVIIHPNHSGWTADLALVHTFAGMMSDKPGLIVPLASDKTITPVDSDVTVFSWGQFRINNHVASKLPSKIEENDSSEDRYEVSKSQTERHVIHNVTSYTLLQSHTEEDEQSWTTSHKIETSNSPIQFKRQRQRRKKRKYRKIIRQRQHSIENQGKYNLRQASTETRSKYRTRPLQYGNIAIFDTEAKILNWDKKKANLKRFYIKVPTTEGYRSSKQFLRATSYYRNHWRRKMGNQKKKLAVEIFGFVNMQMCKKSILKGKPSIFELSEYNKGNLNEVLCYASDGHYVTEEDSGAPAMRRGRLVAVTVGGVNYEGERLAVGLKMTCFCSWISDNIPVSGTKWVCCKNCCETKDETEQKHLPYSHAHEIKTRSKKTKNKVLASYM